MVAAETAGLCEVRLYGHLKAKFGRSHWLAVDSPAEALRALCVLFKGFRREMSRFSGRGYRVLVGEGPATDCRDASDLDLRIGRARLIRVAPVIHGRKRGGVLQTVIGTILIVAGIYSNNPDLVKYGAIMVLGGVVQLVSPQKKTSSPQDSSAFSGGVNQTNPGGPVPLVIGRYICGSTQVSVGMTTDDEAKSANVVPTAPMMPPNEDKNPIGATFPVMV